MLDYMKHLRFVHNAQTILCLAVMYMIVSSWTSGTEVLADLDGFIQTMQRARHAVETPGDITYLVPSVRRDRERTNRDLSATLGHEVSLIVPRVLRATTSLPVESESIGRQWTALQKQQWTLKEVDITDQDFTEVREWYKLWYARWGTCVLKFKRDSSARRDRFALRRSYHAGRRSATPDFRIIVPNWRESSSVVSATIEFIAYIPVSRSHPSCRTASNLRHHGLGEDWTLSPDSARFGPYELPVRTSTIVLPQSTFDRYHYLQRVLSSIRELTPNEVREWAMRDKVSEIRERESRLFGTPVRGEDLGVVAPGAILGLHLYILFTLLSVYPKSVPKPVMNRPFPWFAAMRTTVPTLFTFVTLALCPAVAVALALWRLTAVGILVSGGCFLVMLALGTSIMWLARHVGDGSSESARQDSGSEATCDAK